MFVLGTAGHVDHGKSALIQALTDIDPDRLPEEKARGMTIDLGFAWLRLPSGREVSIIDVPGHERFVKNMLAGVGGIDLALLVVAADEGPMPQTREHLAILDLLGVNSGIVVITKKDLVDQEWLELVTFEVGDLIAETGLSQAPILAVSAVTGDGLPELVSTIDHLLDSTQPKRDFGRPRLPIDRVFSMSGFGTVVTGTLIDGCFSLGQEVQILPAGLKARVRGLQMHKEKIEMAQPGSRVAINLVGVTTTDLKRGDVVTAPGWLKPTRLLDLKLRLLATQPHPLRHNASVTFHTGASEVMSKIRLLEADELRPGKTGWAQALPVQPVAVVKGDRFIIRSPQDTLGGGEIVDPFARRHRRSQPAVINRLAAMEKGDARDILLTTLEAREPLELGTLLTRSNLPPAEAKSLAEELVAEGKLRILGGKGAHSLVFSTLGWRRMTEKVEQVMQSYYQQFPLRRGMPKEELRSRLKMGEGSFFSAMQQLIADGVLREEGTTVCLPSHQIQLTAKQQAVVDAFLDSLTRDPYSPPSDVSLDPEVLNFLIEEGKVVKVAEGIIFATSAYDKLVEGIVDHIKSQGKITVAEVRDLFKTSRKYAVALMEYLDEKKVTRRIGDERVLR